MCSGEHEQVRQVRSRQEQRGGVGHEDAAVEKRAGLDATPASDLDQHWREEHDRGVEVEHRGDQGDQREARKQQCRGRARQALETCGCSIEQTIAPSHEPNQQQPGNEHKRRPCLRERGARIGCVEQQSKRNQQRAGGADEHRAQLTAAERNESTANSARPSTLGIIASRIASPPGQCSPRPSTRKNSP